MPSGIPLEIHVMEKSQLQKTAKNAKTAKKR
jgi:hypothetical protein